ncbi:MAG: class F sortase, partial [Roseiflexaceae bacterium]
MIRKFIVIISVIGATILHLPPITHAQSDTRCFVETGYCIGGRIRAYWEKHGGVRIFGYPIGAQMDVPVEGIMRTVQYFERNRLEVHPEQAAPYD